MSERGQILLTDAFKSKVFAALKAGEPRQAQQLCFELAKENEDHAKQIYSHLLKTARKRGWVKGKSKSSSASEIPVSPLPSTMPSRGRNERGS